VKGPVQTTNRFYRCIQGGPKRKPNYQIKTYKIVLKLPLRLGFLVKLKN